MSVGTEISQTGSRKFYVEIYYGAFSSVAVSSPVFLKCNINANIFLTVLLISSFLVAWRLEKED